MKSIPEKTYDTEPMVLSQFVACVQYSLDKMIEEQRVVALIEQVAVQFDGKKINAKFSKAMSAAFPEYRVTLEHTGFGPFQSWYIYVRDESYSSVASEQIVVRQGTDLVDSAQICAIAFSRKVVSDKYLADYRNALNNAETIVAEHNAALTAMQAVHAKIGNALHAVQSSRR